MSTSKFSNEDLTRWKREINPAPIIGARVKLSRDNTEWLGLCPFHEEKTPSFKIWKLDEGVWGYKCFGCQANGNVFQFVQKFDKISFTAAVEKVLAEAGVEGWEDGTPQSDPTMPEREKREIVTFPFAKYYAENALANSEEARAWLTARGISMETARGFHIGFVQDATAVCGTSHPWAKLGWVLFPTLSDDGRTVVSVKYRSIVSKKEKIDGKQISGILRAQNTATMLFNLRSVKTTEDVWIVEGEPDTLVLAQAGVIAVGYPSAGYPPTEEECELLSTVKRRFLAGDNDTAGTKAMNTLKTRLRGATYIIRWPNNRKDANDVLTNECGNDADEFQILLRELQSRAVQTETEPILRNGNEITPQRIKWLWENKIPLGKITLFAGNPDNGKSLAVTSVAAICSRGDKFKECYFQQEPADVLMLLGEDDLEDTAIPRLMAADADLSKIHFLEAVRPVALENREVRLDMDIPAIERQLKANPNIRLLIIDPISNYLGAVSMVAEQEVRSILIPLKRAAEEFNIAVVLVMHLNKKNDLDAISRVGGAMAFIGVARCSWLFARNVQEETDSGDGTSPQEKQPDTFSMLRLKNNLVSANRAGMSYSVLTKHIPVPGEPDLIIPYVSWGEVIDGSAEEALDRSRGARGGHAEPVTPRGVGRPNNELEKAKTWLAEALQDGLAHRSTKLRKDAKEAMNISPTTLERAYEALDGHVKPFRMSEGWGWQLAPMNETGESEGETPQQSELLQVEGAE